MPDDRGEIERLLQSIASAAFPGDVGVRWHARSVTRKANFTCIEAEPVPPTVGYPRFRFVLERAASGEMRDLGCYCLDRGAWSLLYTTPGTTGEWQRLGFGPPSAAPSADESEKRPSVPPKAEWSKTHPRAAGGCLALFGLPFVLGGLCTILTKSRALPSDPRDAPPWIIFAAGIAFLVPGLAFFSAGLWTMATGMFPSGQSPVVQGAV